MESGSAENVFTTGTVVKCVTALSTTIVGQVLCYDHPTRLLVIKDTTSGLKPLLRFLNLALVKSVSSVPDNSGVSAPYAGGSATEQQVRERVRKAEERKRAAIMRSNVTLDGQRTFIHLRKTLDDVCWEGESISVLGRVLVKPPYTPDSVETIGDPSSNAAVQTKEHVRKLISKQHAVQQTRSSSDDAPADPTPSR